MQFYSCFILSMTFSYLTIFTEMSNQNNMHSSLSKSVDKRRMRSINFDERWLLPLGIEITHRDPETKHCNNFRLLFLVVWEIKAKLAYKTTTTHSYVQTLKWPVSHGPYSTSHEGPVQRSLGRVRSSE